MNRGNKKGVSGGTDNQRKEWKDAKTVKKRNTGVFGESSLRCSELQPYYRGISTQGTGER